LCVSCGLKAVSKSSLITEQSMQSFGEGGLNFALCDETESLDSFAYSVTQASLAGARKIDVNTQTMIALRRSTSTQTDHVPERIVVPSSLQAHVGCPPRPEIEIDAQTRKVVKYSRRRSLKRTPRFGKPFLTSCRGTPATTVEFIILEHLVMVNPLGGGCCFYHASLNYFAGVTQQLLGRECDHDVLPNQCWQCHNCCALHDEDPDSDDALRVRSSECPNCGYERIERAIETSGGLCVSGNGISVNTSSCADESASCVSMSSSLCAHD